MLTDEYVKQMADLSQVQATVPDCMKYSAHFEYQDLCSRLIRAQRQLVQSETPNSMNTPKYRLSALLKPALPRSKSTSRPHPQILSKSIMRPLSIRKVINKDTPKTHLNASVRFDPASLSPLARRTKPEPTALVLNRSFTVTQGKSLKGLAAGSRSLFRLKPALRK